MLDTHQEPTEKPAENLPNPTEDKALYPLPTAAEGDNLFSIFD